jgi:hypothetical protein
MRVSVWLECRTMYSASATIVQIAGASIETAWVTVCFNIV